MGLSCHSQEGIIAAYGHSVEIPISMAMVASVLEPFSNYFPAGASFSVLVFNNYYLTSPLTGQQKSLRN